MSVNQTQRRWVSPNKWPPNKTWENDGKWECVALKICTQQPKKWGYMEGEQRLQPLPTRPWRFPGHIQRLHRKAEEERQQRHSLVDQ